MLEVPPYRNIEIKQVLTVCLGLLHYTLRILRSMFLSLLYVLRYTV